jgi:hypothetical protein
MHAAQLLQLVKSGDVLLFEGTRWYSWLIKLWTLARFSHAAMVMKIAGPSGELKFVCEALEPNGVRLYPLDRLLEECAKDGTRVHWYTLAYEDDVDRFKMVDYALRQLGKRYVSLFQMVCSFGRLTRLIQRKLGYHHALELDADRFFCSEFVASALLAGGFKPDSEADFLPVTTDPGSIAEMTCLRPMGVMPAEA